MNTSTTAMADEFADADRRDAGQSFGARPAASAVSWGAIVAGAAAAAALSLILLILGVGLGLSSVSPWADAGIGAATLGIGTIAWLTLTQLLASAMGGYLAGRLRSRWSDVHRDEVFFRDTAHGFLAWAVSSLATATLLSSAIAGIVGGGMQAGASVAGGAAGTAAAAAGGAAVAAGTGSASEGAAMGYLGDVLFRKDSPAAAAPGSASAPAEDSGRSAAMDSAEIGRIFMNAGAADALPSEDLRHAAQIVAQRAGLSQPDAEKRVAEVHAKSQAKLREAETATRAATNKARRASAYGALWLFVSLLIGAFVASLSATFGGRQRDA